MTSDRIYHKKPPTTRSLSPYTLLLWILSFSYHTNTIQADGQEHSIIPFIPGGNDPIFRSFLEPCETLTLQTQCTEEEYENNEDCLPQKTDNCDHSKELFCLSGVCLPNCHPHKETYDNVEGKCFRKVGSDCRSQNATTRGILSAVPPITQSFSDSSVSTDKGHGFEAPRDREMASTKNDNGLLESEQGAHSTVTIAECEKNSVCERSQCRCVKNYTYDHNINRCILYAGFADYCNETVNCDRKSDIQCRENQCQCKSQETQYFHLKRKRCYILIGQVCSSGLQFCPDSSNCVRKKGNPIMFPFQPGQSYSNSTQDHQLFRIYQDIFINGNDGVGDEDEEEEHFIGIMGDDEESREFACKCDKGYGSTRDKRFCLGLHGTRCNTLHRCNTERGLKCFDGTCLCEREREGEQTFSQKFQTCVTTIGTHCNAKGKGEREGDICPIGASCSAERKCTCDPGLTPSFSPLTTSSAIYACMKGHGMSCKNNNVSSPPPQGIDLFEAPCNLEIGLECSFTERKCLCKDSNQFYDVTKGKCDNFRMADEKIPVIHFTPPDDREYAFHKNDATTGTLSASMICTVLSWRLLYFIFSCKCCYMFDFS